MQIPIKYQGATTVQALSNMLNRCKEQLVWYLDLKAEPITCRLCFDICCGDCAWAYCAGKTCSETGLFIKKDRYKRKNRVAQLRRWIKRFEKEIADRG